MIERIWHFHVKCDYCDAGVDVATRAPGHWVGIHNAEPLRAALAEHGWSVVKTDIPPAPSRWWNRSPKTYYRTSVQCPQHQQVAS